MTIRPRFLNANETICVAGDLENVRKFADRDELVDADGLRLALGLGGARRFELFARPAAHVARPCDAPVRRASGHRVRDVRIHRLLIDRAALAFLARPPRSATLAAPATGASASPAGPPPPGRRRTLVIATRAWTAGPPPGAADATGRGGKAAAARDRTRTRRSRRDGARTRTVRRAGMRVRRGRCADRRRSRTAPRTGSASDWCASARSSASACAASAMARAASAARSASMRTASRRAASAAIGFMLRGELRGHVRRSRRDGGLFLGGGLDVGGFATTPDRGFVGGGEPARGPAPARQRRGGDARVGARGRLLLRTHALFTLPARANARDLVVGEHTHMTANGMSIWRRSRDDFFGGHAEFVAPAHRLKACSNTLLTGLAGEPDDIDIREYRPPTARSTMPTTAVWSRPPPRPIRAADGTSMNLTRRALSSGTILSTTVARRVARDDREHHLVLLRRLPHLLHSHDHPASAHAKPEQPQHPLLRHVIHARRPTTGSRGGTASGALPIVVSRHRLPS